MRTAWKIVESLLLAIVGARNRLRADPESELPFASRESKLTLCSSVGTTSQPFRLPLKPGLISRFCASRAGAKAVSNNADTSLASFMGRRPFSLRRSLSRPSSRGEAHSGYVHGERTGLLHPRNDCITKCVAGSGHYSSLWPRLEDEQGRVSDAEGFSATACLARPGARAVRARPQRCCREIVGKKRSGRGPPALRHLLVHINPFAESSLPCRYRASMCRRRQHPDPRSPRSRAAC